MGHLTIKQAVQARRNRGGLVLGAFVVMAALALAACGSSDSGDGASSSTTDPIKDATTTTAPGAQSDADLDGKAFTSTEVEGYDLVAGSAITLAFDGDRLSANAGCNSLGSTYSFADGTLKWTAVPMATMMACEDDLMAQETWLVGLLTEGVDAALDGSTLTLTSDDVTITLEAGTDATLTGTTWTLTGTISRDAMTPVDPSVKAPTLIIEEDGAAAVFTGCNSGSSTVEITDDTLTFSPIAMTKAFCDGAAGELEAQVTTVLDGEVTYVDDGTTLTIGKGDQGLVYAAS